MKEKQVFPPGEFITDGFDNYWPVKCPYCGQKTMIVIRPGWAKCKLEEECHERDLRG